MVESPLLFESLCLRWFSLSKSEDAAVRDDFPPITACGPLGAGAHAQGDYPPVQYIPRKNVDITQLQRTAHQTYCPYKGECAYHSIPADGERSANAAWSYEAPYAAVSAIREYLAFNPNRVDAIEIDSKG
jgi:hypothetical protein